MIERKVGNILESNTEAVVNTVNCVGVMGKGIALQFRQAYPENFTKYKNACDRKEVRPGRMFLVETHQIFGPKYIFNFPTKRHWKGRSKLEDIEAGLDALIEEVRRLGIKSISVPPLGCGNGGLEWDVVRPLIESSFKSIPEVHLALYEPQGAPEPDEIPVKTERPKWTSARAAYVKLIGQYCLPGYRLSLLEIQKLAYFLQEAGEPLRLQFVKQQYGPYADNLNHVLQRMEGHFIRGYGDRSRAAQIHLLSETSREADEFLMENSAANRVAGRLSRVIELIEGFETPYGLELLSSVHWVANKEEKNATDPDEAIQNVHAWNSRKRSLFSADHIKIAWQRLEDQGWLTRLIRD